MRDLLRIIVNITCDFLSLSSPSHALSMGFLGYENERLDFYYGNDETDR